MNKIWNNDFCVIYQDTIKEFDNVFGISKILFTEENESDKQGGPW